MKLLKFFKKNFIDNKGLTLVELVAAMAVASLVVIGCGAFMVSASKYFSRESAETSMQEEAQLVKNLLNNVVVDTQLAIGKMSGWDVVSETDDTVLSQPTLMVFGKEKIFFLAFDEKEGKMYYKDPTVDEALKSENEGDPLTLDKGNLKTWGSWETWQPLADHVENFTISLERIDNYVRIVTCTLDFQLRNRTYKTSHTITLRNNIMEYKDDPEEVYSGDNALKPTIERVVITPNYMVLPLGASYKFDAAVLGRNNPSQVVTWTIEDFNGGTPDESNKQQTPRGSTIDQYGNVTISATESSTHLRIYATTIDLQKKEHSGDADIFIGNLISNTIRPTSKATPDEDGKYNLGQKVPFEAILQGSHTGDSSIILEWSVTKVFFPAVGIKGSAGYEEEKTFNVYDDPDKAEIAKYVGLTPDANGRECILHIKPQTRPGAKITLQCIANMGGLTQTGSYTIEVSSKSAGDLTVTTDGQFDLKRNGVLPVRATVLGFPNETIEWSISNSYGGRITLPKSSISGETIYIRANNALDYTKGFTFTLTATAKESENISEQVVSKVVTIKPVSITFEGYEKEPVIVVVGQPARVPVKVEGLEVGGGNATYKVMKYVRNMVAPYYANDKLVIAVTLPSGNKKLPDYQETTILATLKNEGTVTGRLNVKVFNSNITIVGYNYCYVPVPGDKTGLFPGSDENPNMPTSDRPKRTVNGVDYFYYIDNKTNPNTWGIEVANPFNKNVPYKFNYDSNTGKFVRVQ